MDLATALDVIEIQQLLAKCAFALDAKDFDVLDGVFTPDAWIDCTQTSGKSGDFKKMKAYYKRAHAPFTITQHVLGLPQIRIDGNHAEVRTMVFNPMQLARQGGDYLFFCGSTCDDRLSRTPDGWRIASRAEVDLWVKDPPADFSIDDI